MKVKLLYFTNGKRKPSYDESVEDWLLSTVLKGKTRAFFESEDCRKLSNRQDYDADKSLRGFFNEFDEENHVIIIPELCWEDSSGFDCGYEVALDLLNSKVDGKFFNLLFISLLNRGQLRERVSSKYRVLVDAFPHVCLFDLPDEWVHYTKLHFEMIRRIAVSESGRLDTVAHNLASVVGRPIPEARRELLETLEVLSLPVYLIKGSAETLKAMRERVEQLEGDDPAISGIVDELRMFVERVKNSLAAYKNEEWKEQRTKKLPYTVLVVEDDREYREDMVEFLKEFFESENIDALNDEEVLSANRIIRERSKDRDIIFLDMMYYENSGEGRTWLPFNGLDLYHEVQDKVVRLITGLPRNEISRITKKCGLFSPVVITKSGGWEQLKSNLRGRMGEIVDECAKMKDAENQALNYPRNEPFGSMSNWLRSNTRALAKAIDFSERVLIGKLKLHDDDPVKPQKGSDEQYRLVLPSLLAHRRIVLSHFISEQAGKSVDYKEYLKGFVSGGKVDHDSSYYTTKEYINTRLGLSVKSGNVDVKKNLFPFEARFVNEGNPLPKRLDSWAKALVADVRNKNSRYDEEQDDFVYDELPVTMEDIFSENVLVSIVKAERLYVPEIAFAAFLDEILSYLNRPDVDSSTRLALWCRCDANPMPSYLNAEENAHIRKIMKTFGTIQEGNLTSPKRPH